MPPGHMPCTGFEAVGTWYINYAYPSGTYKTNVRYRGTARDAFLPDTKEGREVLALLVKAFERRHTFTVGTSVTTGQQNCVVWNGIHHKTSLMGGPTYFGYPDPTYFNRVKLELADRGIFLESESEVTEIAKI